MHKFRTPLTISAILLLLAASPVEVQAQVLRTQIQRLGSETPTIFRTHTGAGPTLSDGESSALTNATADASFGVLSVNVNTGVAVGPPSATANAFVSAGWNDNFNFIPTDTGLIGTSATARFYLSLSGDWSHTPLASSGLSYTSYDILLNDDPFKQGSYNVNGNSGELNIGNISFMTVDIGFVIGTPFTVQLWLEAGQQLSNDAISMVASTNLTLISTNLQALDNSSNPISGSYHTDSGASYQVIPEPATWALAPALLGLVAVWRRKRQAL